METLESEARLPLVLGVTGHRKLDLSRPQLAECVRGELLKLRQTYPHCPFLIVSGLADGADRLVARLAMDVLSAKLIAILPFSEAEYRKDFTTPASQNEFSEFLKQAQAVVIAPQREDAAAMSVPGPARNRQYARAGAYVVENAQVLIALWDGQPARGTGGTGDVVKWRLTGEIPVELSTLNEQRNVLWPKPVARLIHVNPTTCEVKYPDADASADAALLSLNGYNQEVSGFAAEQGATVLEQSWKSSLNGRDTDPLIQQNPGLLKLLRSFGAADALAARDQKRDNALILTVALLLFLAMASYNYTLWKWAMALYALFLITIAVVDRWAARKRIEVRFFDHRALAEGLRVAVFWRLAGLPRRVSQNYLNQHLGTLSWIREALGSAEMASLTSDVHKPDAARINFVREVWLQGQADYFDRKVEQLRVRIKLLSRYTTVAFFVSWAVAVSKLFTGSADSSSWLMKLVILSGPFLAAGIALGFYRQKRALDGIMRRYALSRELYDRSAARLQAGNYPPETVLLEIGREALNENADWLWLQRSTPLKPRR